MWAARWVCMRASCRLPTIVVGIVEVVVLTTVIIIAAAVVVAIVIVVAVVAASTAAVVVVGVVLEDDALGVGLYLDNFIEIGTWGLKFHEFA